MVDNGKIYDMETYIWYQALNKPLWAPPCWIFGPVWTVLYAIIVVTFGTVFYKAFTKQIPWLVALPFALNLLFNFAFSPIQFGLKNNLLASLDILLILGTLIWAFASLYVFGLKYHIQTGAPVYTWIIYANIPYFLWVSFATALQLTITYFNRS
jgi:tryptophan-rich sensory protein